MRAIAIIVAGGLFSMAAATGIAQERSALEHRTRTCAAMVSYKNFDIDLYGCAYVRSLESENEGIVESALREAILIKLAQPTATCPGIHQALDRLADNGATTSIRLKASIAKLVYENPALFVEEGYREYVTDGDVFEAITERIEQTLLASYE